MREGKHTQRQDGPADAGLEELLYLLGRERQAAGSSALREHQLGDCGHRTTMEGYCWFCQARTGRGPAFCPLGHANWPNEESCVTCGLPAEAPEPAPGLVKRLAAALAGKGRSRA